MTTSDTPLDKLTRVYIKMRDAKAKLAAEYKEKDEGITSQMDQVKAALLDYCREHDVESVRTASGLVYRTTRTRYWTSDWEENPETVPPGINADSEYTITVRKA